jgi:hypothetical protein
VKSWGKCETNVAGIKVPAEIKPCNLQMTQQSKTTASDGIVSACLIKMESKESLCEIQIPAGMETDPETDSGINVGLLESAFTAGPSSTIKVNITRGGRGEPAGGGLYASGAGKGILCVVPKATQKAGLTGFQFEAEGLSASAVPEFVSEKYPDKFEGESESAQELVLESADFKCLKTIVKGILEGPSPELSFVPTYSDCTARVEGKESSKAEVLDACYLDAYELTPIDMMTGTQTGRGGFIASPGPICELTIKVGTNTCNVMMQSQLGPPGSAKVTPNTGTGTVTISYKIENIVYTSTGCGSGNNGKYEGTQIRIRNTLVDE